MGCVGSWVPRRVRTHRIDTDLLTYALLSVRHTPLADKLSQQPGIDLPEYVRLCADAIRYKEGSPRSPIEALGIDEDYESTWHEAP